MGAIRPPPTLIERLWSDPHARASAAAAECETQLQEWAQARGLPTPAYREIERKGPDHDPEFRVTVELRSCPGRGARPLQAGSRAGRSRRHAQRVGRQGGPPRWMMTGVRRLQRPRCGFVALIGATQRRKSTLINALVGTKVAIVSHKVQTTRSLLRGIAIAGEAQLIFIDTPGIFAPKRRLDRPWCRAPGRVRTMPTSSAVLIDARRGIDDAGRRDA